MGAGDEIGVETVRILGAPRVGVYRGATDVNVGSVVIVALGVLMGMGDICLGIQPSSPMPRTARLMDKINRMIFGFLVGNIRRGLS